MARYFGPHCVLLFIAVIFGLSETAGAQAISVQGACSGQPVRTIWQGGDALYARVANGTTGAVAFNNSVGLDGERCEREKSGQTIAGGYRINIPKGCISTGVHEAEAFQKQERAVLDYEICFSPNFDFRGGKLPSLSGGAAAGAGRGAFCEGFSAGMMFGNARGADRNEGGAGVSYTYWCEQKGAYGGCGAACRWAAGARIFEAGGCHRISEQVVMNTPGQRDGATRVWVDGELVGEKTDYLFRPAGRGFGVERVRFSFWYGGGSASWASNDDVYAEFKNFVVRSDPWFCEEDAAAR